MNCFLDGELSLYEYSLKNALLFSQGDWELIKRDLVLANVNDASIQALEDGPCAELIRAFRIRRELIHYKKVCLHLFEEARKIERELKQAMSFFFWYDNDNIEEGKRAHLEAIIALTKLDCDENNDLSPLHLNVVKDAIERHEIPESCTLLDRKLLYVIASGAWMYHRGVSKALHDARDVAKAICMSPRHIDGERPFKLRADNGSLSMQVKQSVNKAEGEDPLDTSRMKKKEKRIKEDGIKNYERRDQDNNNSGSINEINAAASKGRIAMSRILDRVKTELNWPEEAIQFLSLSIAARGGFKALSIVEELEIYCLCLSNLPSRIEIVRKRFTASQLNAINSFTSSLNENVSDETLSAAVSRHKEIHQMHGLLKACRENAKWVSVLNCLDSKEVGSRLFVAGDDAASNNTCAFVPKGFQLGSFVASSRQILDKILLPTMRRAIQNEFWPPTLGSRRTRVLAFDTTTIKTAKVGKKKLQQCNTCSGYFDSRWIRHQICSVCEAAKRHKKQTECFFVDCKAGPDAFCPHFSRCFVCDAPHSCDLCRLTRGDGEVASALVETIQPKALFLDFDRTLASTKSGASPLPPKKKGRHTKEGYSHSIDPELKLAVLAQQAFGESYVITRNSHKTEIETFLRMHSLPELANNVHVVKKKMPKGEYIREIFSCSEEVGPFLFIDDDIRELSNDTWLRTSPNIYRLLFVRAFLQ